MSHKVEIYNQEGGLVNSWPVDNDQIVRAVGLEVELHNRDNPEDQWTFEVLEVEE